MKIKEFTLAMILVVFAQKRPILVKNLNFETRIVERLVLKFQWYGNVFFRKLILERSFCSFIFYTDERWGDVVSDFVS